MKPETMPHALEHAIEVAAAGIGACIVVVGAEGHLVQFEWLRLVQRAGRHEASIPAGIASHVLAGQAGIGGLGTLAVAEGRDLHLLPGAAGIAQQQEPVVVADLAAPLASLVREPVQIAVASRIAAIEVPGDDQRRRKLLRSRIGERLADVEVRVDRRADLERADDAARLAVRK